jgi:outer membrane protein TolC
MRCNFLLVLFFTAQSAFASPLGLEGALKFALENSPAYDSARKKLEKSELEVKTARARFLPSLDFATTNGLQDNFLSRGGDGVSSAQRNPTNPWYGAMSVTLTENLYDNGASITRAREASLKTELARLELEKLRDKLLLDITQEFHRFSLAHALLGVRRQQLAMLEKQYRMMTDQYKQGLKTRSDYLRFKTQTQRAEIDLSAAESRILESSAELRRLVGAREERLEFKPIDPVEPKSAKIATALARPNLNKFYEARIQILRGEIASKAVDLARRENWPRAFVSSGAAYTNDGYINSRRGFLDKDEFSWNVLFTVQFNLWDWGTRRREVEKAAYDQGIEENSARLDMERLIADVEILMADQKRVAQAFALSRELLTFESESLSNLERRYREGSATYLDLITAINNFLDARTQFFSAHFSSLTNQARHAYFEGRLYETNFRN